MDSSRYCRICYANRAERIIGSIDVCNSKRCISRATSILRNDIRGKNANDKKEKDDDFKKTDPIQVLNNFSLVFDSLGKQDDKPIPNHIGEPAKAEPIPNHIGEPAKAEPIPNFDPKRDSAPNIKFLTDQTTNSSSEKRKVDDDTIVPSKKQKLSKEEPYEDNRISGLKLIFNFIEKQEEADLLQVIDNASWSTELTRRVQHYGYKYDYAAKKLGPHLGPLPEPFSYLTNRLVDRGLFKEKPDQMIINEYQPGQGISPHIDRDDLFKQQICSLSLGSGCTMIFRNNDKDRFISELDRDRIEIYLPPRSLLVLEKAARYRWKHEIPKWKSDPGHGQRSRRVSCTFRNVINNKEEK